MAIGSVTKLLVNALLIQQPSIGIQGAPIGTLVCFAFVTLLELIAIKRVTPHPPNYRRVFGKPILASALMGASAWISYTLLAMHVRSFVSVAGAIAVGFGVYIILIFVLRIVSKDDLSLMPKGDKIAQLLRIK